MNQLVSFSAFTSTILGWLASHGVRIVFIFLGAYLGYHVVHFIAHRGIVQFVNRTYNRGGSSAKEKRIETLHGITSSALAIAAFVVALVTVLSELGINVGPMIAAAGIAGVAVGFGGQYFIRDVIAGFFIILEDQYRVGDVVKLAGTSGLVEDITLRDTVLRDLDGIQHYIPNGAITVASNYTKFWSRAQLNIGVAYDTDLQKALDVLTAVGKEMAEDEKWKDKITKPIEAIGVNDFGESAIEIKVLGETIPLEQWAVMREYRLRVKLAFDKAGIEIPFPQRTVYMKQA